MPEAKKIDLEKAFGFLDKEDLNGEDAIIKIIVAGTQYTSRKVSRMSDRQKIRALTESVSNLPLLQSALLFYVQYNLSAIEKGDNRLRDLSRKQAAEMAVDEPETFLGDRVSSLISFGKSLYQIDKIGFEDIVKNADSTTKSGVDAYREKLETDMIETFGNPGKTYSVAAEAVFNFAAGDACFDAYKQLNRQAATISRYAVNAAHEIQLNQGRQPYLALFQKVLG